MLQQHASKTPPQKTDFTFTPDGGDNRPVWPGQHGPGGPGPYPQLPTSSSRPTRRSQPNLGRPVRLRTELMRRLQQLMRSSQWRRQGKAKQLQLYRILLHQSRRSLKSLAKFTPLQLASVNCSRNIRIIIIHQRGKTFGYANFVNTKLFLASRHWYSSGTTRRRTTRSESGSQNAVVSWTRLR